MAQTKGVSVSNTGMDLDALVKGSVGVYQTKYDTAYKQETVTEWTKSAYADLYTELTKFQNNTASAYKLQANTTAHLVASGDSSVVTATANGDAINISHDVTVNTVARNASLQSVATKDANGTITTPTITRGTGTSTSTNLSDVAGITLTDANKDSADVAISFNVQDSADSTVTHTVSYTYKDLQTKTLNDLASDIKKLNTNITGTYDATNDTMNIYNKKAGSSNIIQITANATSAANATDTLTQTNKLLTNLHLATYDGSTLSTALDTTTLSGTTIKGVSSSIKVDGQTYTGNTNAITVAGVTYTANKVSPSGSTTVSVATDTDTLVKSVQTFVDNYNTLIDKFNLQLHATKSTTYGALTADQKSAMTADEITAWETKAQTGLLHNDTMLANTVNDMRTSLSTPVSGLTGDYTTAASLGIKTGTWDTYGHISLDTATLKKAIAADPDAVNKVFASDNTNTSTTNIGSQGVATRLYNLLSVDSKNISDQAGTSASTSDTSVLGTKITDMNTNIAALLKTLQDKQNYYYSKYNDMESAVGQLTSSLTSVTSFLG